MGLFLALGSIVTLYVLANAMKAQASARLTGTPGGAIPAPGAPQITPTTGLRTRNDFPAFSYLGGFTGGNLSPVSVEPVLLDPTQQAMNTELADSHATALVNAPQQGYGTTEPQSAAQTPENWYSGVEYNVRVVSETTASGRAPAPGSNLVPYVFRFWTAARAPATATLERSQI